MTKERIQVREEREISPLTGDFDSIIAMLDNYKEEGWESIEFLYGSCWDETNDTTVLVKHRPETDKEYEKRIAQEQKRKEKEKLDKEKALARKKKELVRLTKEIEKLEK